LKQGKERKMRDKIMEMFPEIEMIKNAELKEKTYRCFEVAMERGGWTTVDLYEMPFTLLIPECNVKMGEHVRGVTKSAINMAEAFAEVYGNKIPVDMDILVSGAILHDVGKLLEYKREDGEFMKSDNGKLLRHPFSGAILAGELGLPDEVVHIIAVHSKEGDHGKRTTEAILVNKADFANFEPLR